MEMIMLDVCAMSSIINANDRKLELTACSLRKYRALTLVSVIFISAIRRTHAISGGYMCISADLCAPALNCFICITHPANRKVDHNINTQFPRRKCALPPCFHHCIIPSAIKGKMRRRCAQTSAARSPIGVLPKGERLCSWDGFSTIRRRSSSSLGSPCRKRVKSKSEFCFSKPFHLMYRSDFLMRATLLWRVFRTLLCRMECNWLSVPRKRFP